MILEHIPSILRMLMSICRCDIRLEPNGRIVRLAKSNQFQWRVVRPDSKVEVKTWRPVFGWVLAHLHLQDNFPHEPELKLDFASGGGKGQQKSIYLIPTGHGDYQAIGFVSFLATSVTFDPGKWEGHFTLREFGLYNVPRLFTRRIGIRALSKYHPDFIGDSHAVIRKKLINEGEDSTKELDEQLEKHLLSRIESDDRVIYETWMRRVEEREIVRHRMLAQNLNAALNYRPLMSLLMVVRAETGPYLTQSIESMQAQLYPDWELCIVGRCPSNETGESITALAERDERIRADVAGSNRNLSRALHAALRMAKGNYVALLDAGDALSPNALLSVVEHLQREPRPRIVYSDEDIIDAFGRRAAPHFKSDWNPDLLYSQNYVSRLAMYESGLVRTIGGFSGNHESQGEYDLVLRASAQVDDELIQHVPYVLYHRRAKREVDDSCGERQRENWNKGLDVVQSFFDEKKNGVKVERGAVPLSYRVRWPIPDPPPLVSIIIPTRDNFSLLKTCVTSLLQKTTYSNYEVLLVDNDSAQTDTLAYLNLLSREDNIRTLNFPGPFNYSAINNYAVAKVDGDLVCLLNDDTEVIDPDWLNELVSHACRSEIGCVGAKLLFPDGRIQHAGVICGIGRVAGHSHRYVPSSESGYFSRLVLTQNVSAVTAACLVIRREIWELLGGLNEMDLPVALNDVDLCLRARRMGLRNLWTPHALLRHHESASRGPDNTPNTSRRYFREIDYMRMRWRDYLQHDPYYSPHLSRRREDFSLAIIEPLPAVKPLE